MDTNKAWTIILVVFVALILFSSLSHAQEVTNAEGKHASKAVKLKLYPQTFVVRAEAEAKATELKVTNLYAEIYQDQDTKQFQIIYGNCHINDVVVLSSMSEV